MSFISIVILLGCKKNVDDTVYTISGKLLESSSNPVPVAGYKLTLQQNGVLSFLGSYEGVQAEAITDNEGGFKFSYSLTSGTGVGTGSTNPNVLYITSRDTSQFKEIYPEYRPISVRADTSLDKIYLYKKINRLVRKVSFTNALNAGETLEVITTGAFGAKYKTLTGPIAAGTQLTVDTILNYKISRLNLQSKQYNVLSVLKKPSFQKDLNVFLGIGDEDYKEIVMTY